MLKTRSSTDFKEDEAKQIEIIINLSQAADKMADEVRIPML